MVKRSSVLADVDAEAEVPYEATRLARQAVAARKRLAGILLVGALVAAIEGVMVRSVLLGAIVVLLAATAWSVRRGRLWGVVVAGLAGLVAALVPLATWAVLGIARPELLPALVVVALGAATLPDVVLLARDAELQHAYGRWARRDA